MNYKHLGRTGLRVSRIGLGTMNFGELTDESASFRIMDEAVDAGINFSDTADVYGGPQSPDDGSRAQSCSPYAGTNQSFETTTGSLGSSL